jgi:anti-sigma factor RsiW
MTHPGRDVLLAHVDGELRDREAVDVARHMETCAVCRAVTAEITQSAGAFATVLSTVDSNEPAAWPRPASVKAGPVVTAPDARPFPLRREAAHAAGPAGGSGLRWAAGILLVSGAAVSAAILGDRLVSGTPERGVSAASTAADVVTDADVAMVVVDPLNGTLRVALSRAAAGSTVHVALADGPAASVAVEGADAPHFTAATGRVQLDLGATVAAVRLTLPYGLRTATVTLDGATIISVDGDVVSHADALERGLRLDSAGRLRIE